MKRIAYSFLRACLGWLGSSALHAQTNCLLTEEVVKNFTYQLSEEQSPLSFREGAAENGRFRIENFFIDSTGKVAFVLIRDSFSLEKRWSLTGIFCHKDSAYQILPLLIQNLTSNEWSVKPSSKYSYMELTGIKPSFVLHVGHEFYAWSEINPYRFHRFFLEPDSPVVKKPAIYLYPEKPINVKVQLPSQALLLTTDPPYREGWQVKGAPGGYINGKLSYLFYEAILPQAPDLPREGWVVPKKELSTWFDKHLPLLGLQGKEITDFKEYWLKNLNDFAYYKIKLISSSYLEKYLPLTIQPAPTTIIRVILYFEGIEVPESLAAPVISPPLRKGFTVVEWGGILKGTRSKDLSVPTYAFEASEVGQVILRSFYADSHRVSIRVHTNGCTNENDIRPIVKVSYPIDPRSPHYDITFMRIKPDWCKGYFPGGVVLTYNLKKDLGIDTRQFYTLSCTNPVFPIGEDVSYFIIDTVRVEGGEDTSDNAGPLKLLQKEIQKVAGKIRQEVKSSVLYAISSEIEFYNSSSRPDRKEKLSFLTKEYERVKALPADSFVPMAYFLSDSLIPELDQTNPLEKSISRPYGPIIPCTCRQVPVAPEKSLYHLGELIPVKGMTKSGPFYHIAGTPNNQPLTIQENDTLLVCFVFKRDYWSFENYYVYVRPIKNKD